MSQRISGDVEVLNGQKFDLSVLKVAISPLVAAKDVDALLIEVPKVREKLALLGCVPKFKFELGSQSVNQDVLPLKTVVDLWIPKKHAVWGTITSSLNHNLNAANAANCDGKLKLNYQLHNLVGYGDTLTFRGAQSGNQTRSGSVVFKAPVLPTNRTLMAKILFKHRQNDLTGGLLNTHAFSAKYMLPNLVLGTKSVIREAAADCSSNKTIPNKSVKMSLFARVLLNQASLNMELARVAPLNSFLFKLQLNAHQEFNWGRFMFKIMGKLGSVHASTNSDYLDRFRSKFELGVTGRQIAGLRAEISRHLTTNLELLGFIDLESVHTQQLTGGGVYRPPKLDKLSGVELQFKAKQGTWKSGLAFNGEFKQFSELELVWG